jgi:hypothetical protein
MREVFVLLEGESISGPIIAVDQYDTADDVSRWRTVLVTKVTIDDPTAGACVLFLSDDADERCAGTLTSSVLGKVGSLPAKGGTLTVSRTDRCYHVEYTAPAKPDFLADVFGE